MKQNITAADRLRSLKQRLNKQKKHWQVDHETGMRKPLTATLGEANYLFNGREVRSDGKAVEVTPEIYEAFESKYLKPSGKHPLNEELLEKLKGMGMDWSEISSFTFWPDRDGKPDLRITPKKEVAKIP